MTLGGVVIGGGTLAARATASNTAVTRVIGPTVSGSARARRIRGAMYEPGAGRRVGDEDEPSP